MKSSRKRILCVDDNHETRDLYSAMLFDYEVMTAATIAETLLMARKHLVDLYLLDASLPDGSGIQLCREIRSFDPNTPILFVSGTVDESDRDEAIKSGAQAYLTKPVAMFDLQATAEALIRQAISRSLEARCIELHALGEAIAEYISNLDNLLASRSTRINAATNRSLRTTGYSVFTNAGGSRVEFERFWPAALSEAHEQVGGR